MEIKNKIILISLILLFIIFVYLYDNNQITPRGDLNSEDLNKRIGQKVIEMLKESNKKTLVAKTEYVINKGKSATLIIGIRNNQNRKLNYFIRFNIMDNWFKIKYKIYRLGENGIDLKYITINPPIEASNGQYYVTLDVVDADSNNVYDSQTISILIK